MPHTPVKWTSLFNIHYLVLLYTFGGLKTEYFAFLLLHQRRAQRRKVRYFVLLHVGLRAPHYLVGVLLFFPLLLYGHNASERDIIAFVVLNDTRVRELFFYRAYPVFGCRLQIARLLILGVLREVTQRASVLKLFGNLTTAHRF